MSRIVVGFTMCTYKMFDSTEDGGRGTKTIVCSSVLQNSRLKLKMHKVCAVIYKEAKARVTCRKLRQRHS